MSSAKDFVVHEGILIKYNGYSIDQKFALPKGITGIGNNVFKYKSWNCKQVVIPQTVETIGSYAFASWLPESSVKEIVIRGDIEEVGKWAFSGIEVDKIRFEGHVGKIGESAFAYSCIKELTVVGGIDSIGKGAFARCSGLKTIDTPWIGKIGKEVFVECSDMDVDAVCALTKNKPTQSPTKAAEKKPAAKKAPAKKPAVDEAICAPWRSFFDEKELTKTFTKLKGAEKLIADVKLADGKPAPSYLVMCAIVPYAQQLKSRPRGIGAYKTACCETALVPHADRVAALLDRETLLEALKKLRSAAGAAWLIPYGRYADTECVKKLLSDMKVWENWDAFGTTGRSDIIIARGALLLSETRDAMLHLDKVGQLETYARMRGTDAATIRDTALSAFGFDEERKITYDLGGNTLIVTIGEDLTLRLTDGTTGKEVKSVPKKNADPKLQESVSASLKKLKKDIKDVVSNRKKALLAEYLSGAGRDAAKWQQLYMKNPVLHAVARLVVWCQEGNTFTLSGDGAVDCRGNAYTFTNAPICVAHPVEMGGQLSAWQDYFVSRGLKQPFEQVWEPAYQAEDINADRFNGCAIAANQVVNQEAHGIRAYGFKFYSEDYGFALTDCALTYQSYGGRYQPDADNRFILGKFSFTKLNRRVNHIVYLFDKWTAMERILADDASVAAVLPAFTAAQIAEFTKLAAKHRCAAVTAILLEYRQKHYPNIDPMAEFVLD